MFEDSLASVKESLLSIFTELLKVTQNVAKPEFSSTVSKEVEYLSGISSQESEFVEKYQLIEGIIDKNVTYMEGVVSLYSKYEYLLGEMERVQGQLKGMKKEEFFREIR